MTALPIEAVLPALLSTLAAGRDAVLEAPPGAGKTTGVPLALLDQPWVAGRRLVVLEPRRLAARAAARRMAAMLGEEVGRTVGYRVRNDARVSAATRIELVTDGLFLRRLKADPALEGIACVLFDEVHERGLDSDLSLALCLEAKTLLREDLRLVAMSATLDGAGFAKLLNAERIVSEGRAFPVETRYREPGPRQRIEDATAAAVRAALAEESGDILVFLPGGGEIRRTAERLGGLPAEVDLHPLHGDLGREAQDAAIAPSRPGRRKVVLATAIAETSLTIEGVRVVIDSGLSRLPRFDPGSGMSRLVTEKVSVAAAEQRRGRAGRLGPGVCIRLWGEAAQRALVAHHPPEILSADLAPLALDLADWGAAEPEALGWIDPPPPAALSQARDLLRGLGAIDAAGRITPHGRKMAAIGAHPRLAHMILAGAGRGQGRLACQIAALIEERDPWRGGRDIDLRHRVELLAGRERGPVDRGALAQIKQTATALQAALPGSAKGGDADVEATGPLLALAYPDRIARARGGAGGRFLMAGGRGAMVDETDPLARAPWLAVGDLDGAAREARVFRAAPLDEAVIEDWFADLIETEETIAFDEREDTVKAVRRRRLGAIVLDEKPLAKPSPEAVAGALIGAIRRRGLSCLTWTPAIQQLRARVALLRDLDGADGGWPDWSDAGLLADLETWLGPYLDGVTRIAHLARIDVGEALLAQLDWARRQRLDRDAPARLDLPSGASAALDYAVPDGPALAVKLQEMFGQADTPTIANGRRRVVVELLSPAGRPLQVTRDLASFWTGAWREVRAEMRGRYPKHDWPEDPANAAPHRGLKRTRPTN